MTRPARRTSALAGLTPAQPVNPKYGEDVPLPLEQEAPEPKTVKAVNAGDTANAGVSTKTSKMTVTIDADLMDRARSAFLADGPRRGLRSLSAWVAEAIETKTLTAEDRLNDGEPFPGTPTGVIPTGRRS